MTLRPEDQEIVDRANTHIKLEGPVWRRHTRKLLEDFIAALHAAAERECVNCPYIERPDPAELKRLIEDVKTTWYGFAIGTHTGIDAVTASAALYKALGLEK